MRLEQGLRGHRAFERVHREHDVVFAQIRLIVARNVRPETSDEVAAQLLGLLLEDLALDDTEADGDQVCPGSRKRPDQRHRDDAVVEQLEADRHPSTPPTCSESPSTTSGGC